MEKLEFYLNKNLELFNSTEFAMICNTISSDRSDPKAIKFDQLLENASSNVMSWLSSEELTSLTDIQNIATAYVFARDSIKLPLRFFELIELHVLKFSPLLSAS